MGVSLAFAAGQISGLSSLIFILFSGAVLGIVAVIASSYRRALLLATAFLAGAIMGCSLETSAHYQFNSEDSYLAFVHERPRRYQVGEVILPLTLLSSATTKSIFPAINARFLCRGIDLPWRNASHLRLGDLVVIRAKFRELNIQDLMSHDAVLKRQGYSSLCRIRYISPALGNLSSTREAFRENIINSVEKVLGNNESAGLFLAMSLGVRDTISTVTEQGFKRAGLAHLLVLSGYQVTILYGSINMLLAICLRHIPKFHYFISLSFVSSIIAFVSCAFFVLITAVEPSSVRAVIAAAIVTLSRLLERGRGFLHSVSVSFVCMCIIWPGCFLEPGVQLTFAALIGIGISIDGSSSSELRRYLKMCFFASLLTSLVGVFWFDGVSVLGFVLNPIIAPIFSFISCNLGILAITLIALDIKAPGEALVRAIAAALELLRDGVLYLASFDWAYQKIHGDTKLIVFSCLGLTLLVIGLRSVIFFNKAGSRLPQPEQLLSASD